MGIPYVFKASYRKANRTSGNSFTGIGDETAMQLIKKVGDTFKLPTTSDIHAHDEAALLQSILIFYRYLLSYAGKLICLWQQQKQAKWLM